MDMIPLENLEPMEDNSYLSERAIFARDKDIERRLTRPKRQVETLMDKMNSTDELIGGVPRRAIWADENPGAFYTLQARLALAEAVKRHELAVQIIAPGLPPTALDGDGAIDVKFEDVPLTPTQSPTPPTPK